MPTAEQERLPGLMKGRIAMTIPRVASVPIAAAAITLATLLPIPVFGQSQPGGAKPAAGATPWKLGTTPDGQPDFQGTWLYFDSTPFETPGGNPVRRRDGETIPGSSDATVATQRAARAAAGEGGGEANVFYSEGRIIGRAAPRRSLVVAPPDGKVPVLAIAAQRNNERQDHFTDSYKFMTGLTRCITRGVPAVGLPYAINNAVRIIQGPGYFTLVYEMIHETRVIPLDGRPHLPKSVRLWNGDSRGRWEGNALVVDTTNYNDQGSVTNSAATGHLLGIQQSEALHVVERFTRVGPETINYEVTIEDPGVYSGSWKVALPLSRNDSYKIFEYGCHEGNYRFMTVALGAGRARENGSARESESRKAAEEAVKSVR
jgi:hypothetical protein